jgi:citrate lyase subunit beta/citryl-CoA lyase
MLEKAEGRGADALIFDLEDGVDASAKSHARALLESFLVGRSSVTTPMWIRVNPRAAVGDDELLADLSAGIQACVSGVVYPKAESIEDLGYLDDQLSQLESSRDRPHGSVAVAPLIESAIGLEHMRLLARSPRVSRLQLGEHDLLADLGVIASPDESELLPWRSLVVAVSRAASIASPVGSAETAIGDSERLRETTMRLRRLGFSGRTVIHPSQISAVRDVFRPTPDEIADAREVLSRFEAAKAQGEAVTRDGSGRMVDEAVAREARRLLAEAAGAGEPQG